MMRRAAFVALAIAQPATSMEQMSHASLAHAPRAEANSGGPRSFHWDRAEDAGAVSASDLSQSVMHLMGAPALSHKAEAELPAVNAAAPPKANVMMAIEGANVEDGHMPFLASMFANNPTAPVQAQNGGHVAGEVANRVHGGMNALDLEGYTMCLSADKRVHRSGLCSTAQDSLAWDDQAMGFRQQRSSLYGADKMAAHVPMPQDKEAPLMRAFSKAGGKAQLDGETWTLTPPAPAGKAGHQPLKAEFDLADEADALLLEELNLACHVASGLPDAVEDASATKSLSDRPDLFFMTVNALPHLLDEHGDDSPKAHAAMSLVDAAAREVLAGISARYDDQVAAAVLMDNSVAARPLHDEFHRFLSATNAPTMTPGYNSSVSIEQIVEYNIGLWTGIVMVLILLSALCCMINMDIQPDSLLYAKFQADVSSKLD